MQIGYFGITPLKMEQLQNIFAMDQTPRGEGAGGGCANEREGKYMGGSSKAPRL